MAVCQWKIQREALMSLSTQRGPSSVYYNNSGDDFTHQGRSSTPKVSQERDDKGHMSSAEVMTLLAEQQAKLSDMMMAMMTQMTSNNSQQLEIQQAEETRKREVHEQKSGIANRISGMAKCLQPQSF
jgi:hypothetical protein